MIITKKVEVCLISSSIKHYEDLGYEIPRYYNNKKEDYYVKIGTKMYVDIKDLFINSHALIDVKCDHCFKLLKMEYRVYNRCKKDNDIFYCRDCNMELGGYLKRQNTLIKKSKSFEEWCIKNNKKDILGLWDYNLNNDSPKNVTYSSNKKHWFLCPNGIHKSELKYLSNVINGYLKCNQCNSIAQWGIDNLGEDFLEKYWDYEKNTKDPWEICKGNARDKVWIKCINKEYHSSYNIRCADFIKGDRCPYCSNKKIHFLDSLGYLYPKSLDYWSNKNKKSPFEYSPFSSKYVWWKCDNREHEDYRRTIKASNYSDFICPYCQFSKGEKRIERHLKNKNINYTPQKTFDDLMGRRNKKLSYDFYLFDYNLLIEYQGAQHERFIKGMHNSIEDFNNQVKNDKHKKEYANKNKFTLLEVWYWDFNNIEKILNDKLIINK